MDINSTKQNEWDKGLALIISKYPYIDFTRKVVKVHNGSYVSLSPMPTLPKHISDEIELLFNRVYAQQ